MIYRTDEDQNWFYVHEGRREGPFDRRALIQALLGRDAPEKTLVWRSGLSHWTRAGELQELRLELPPPIPREAMPGEPGVADEPLPPVPPDQEAGGGSSSGVEDEDDGDDEPDPPAAGQGANGTPTQRPAEGEASGTDADSSRRRRRRKRKHTEPAYNPRVLQLAVLFLMLALVVWFLLRRMNQFPEGTVIDHGRLEGAPTETETRQCASGGTSPGAFVRPPPSRL
jgi:hypothetical protein